jgi:hypothetical protein
MIELKKSEIEATLLTICVYSLPKENETQRMIGGLLSENLSLGTKRRLQKIHKLIVQEYKDFIEDFKKLNEECKDNKEKLEKEKKILLDEIVKLDIEPAQLSQIEAISTSNNYNFEIIEKIAN